MSQHDGRRVESRARRRVGLVLPSVNAVVEPEFWSLAPAAMSFHSTRVPLRETTPEALRAMNASLEAACLLLRDIRPELVVYACTSGSLIDGSNQLQLQVRRLEQVVESRVITTAGSVVDALRYLGVSQVALATPYVDAVNAAEIAFLQECDIETVRCTGLGLSGDAIREVPAAEIDDLALRADDGAAEALFISCTDLRALPLVHELERKLDKPVVTSNQATLWAMLRELGEFSGIENHGRLLDAGSKAVS